jgi:hypothetical protein
MRGWHVRSERGGGEFGWLSVHSGYGFAALNRRFLIPGLGFLLLLVATGLAWNHRFQQPANIPAWTLSDLRRHAPDVPEFQWIGGNGNLRLRIPKPADGEGRAIRLAFAGARRVDGLHFGFRIRSENLAPGTADWHDGRVFIEWHRPSGGSPQEDYLTSVRHSCEQRETGFILRAPRGGAVPALRFEHLGHSGFLEVVALDITPVNERPWWKPVAWLLVISWWAWIWFAICRKPGQRFPKAGGAAALWTCLALLWIVPGPWKACRPMRLPWSASGFELFTTRKTDDGNAGGIAGGSIRSASTEPSGEIPVQGSVFLKLKYWIEAARPLFHAMMLAVPALVFCFLAGPRRALLLCVLLALGIEGMQVTFGYGFGPDDAGDLLMDAFGIALGLFAYRYFFSRSPSNPARQP